MTQPQVELLSGTAARRTRRRSTSCARRWPSSGSTPTQVLVREVDTDRRADASASSARPRSASTASTSRTRRRAGGADLPRLPSPRRPRLARSRPGRRARRPPQRDDHEERSMSTAIGDRRPHLHAARHRRRRAASPGDTPGDARRLHLQPLPVRAGLARPHRRRGRGLPRRARSSPSTPTTPSATRATPSTRCASASTPTAAGRCPTSTTRARRSPRLRRQDDARLLPDRRRGPDRLPRRARRRLPGPVAERRLAARGARRGARRARAPEPAETKPVGCSIKWKQ